MARLDRLTEDFLGDWKNAGGGVHDPGFDYGLVYGVCYAQDGLDLILLLRGGTTRTQGKDIEKAHAYWKDYKTRSAQRAVSRRRSPAQRHGHCRLHRRDVGGR